MSIRTKFFNRVFTAVRAIGAAIACGALAVASFSSTPASGLDLVPKEYELKAAFVYKFINFIEWSDGTNSTQPRQICIVGDDPFKGIVQKLVSVHDPEFNRVSVRYPRSGEEVVRCSLLYISASQDANVERFISALRDLPIVTVSDIHHFARRGGMIELTVDNESIRFIINQKRAREAGVHFSSQLLALAKELITVEDRP
ncbi:MAG: YfiR family protein [Bdellovibrionota bacterium]